MKWIYRNDIPIELDANLSKGYISYDLWKSEYRLNENGFNKISELFNWYKTSSRSKNCRYSISKTAGYINHAAPTISYFFLGKLEEILENNLEKIIPF